MDTKKRVVFIVNPISGTQSKKSVVEKIEKYADGETLDIRIVPTAKKNMRDAQKNKS